MSDSEQNELKAGHPPAMKVGGKRVPLPKHHADDKAEAPKTEETEEKTTPSKTVVISGAQVKEKEVYSAEATRAIHEKPVPTHSNYDGGHQVGPHGSKQAFIQQPRKQ